MNEQPQHFEETSHYHAVIVIRRPHVPINEAWSAWTDSGRISQWFSPDTVQDVRVGGRYANGDGDRGEFLEVEPERRLKFTWEQPDYAPGGYVMVDFVPVTEDVTEVRVEHANVACDDAADLDLGWQWSMDSMVSYLETGIAISFEQWAAARGLG